MLAYCIFPKYCYFFGMEGLEGTLELFELRCEENHGKWVHMEN